MLICLHLLFLDRHHLVLDNSFLVSDDSSPPSTPNTPPPSPVYSRQIQRRHSEYTFQNHCKTGQFVLKRNHSSSHLEFPKLNSVDRNKLTKWSEYSVRRSLTKFRTRKSATRLGQRRRSGEKPQTPSRTISNVLQNQYEVCQREEGITRSHRLFAVFYCWSYGWIIDVYYSITDEGRDRSFLKWFLSCVLVTLAAMLVLVLSAVTLYYSNLIIMEFINAFIHFGVFILMLLFGVLGMLAIVNFD